jgi:MSHA biogenesis protein MshQ
MNFNSVWLIVLTMLRAGPALLMLAGAAQAANLGFNGGAVASCTYASASQTYTCSTLALGGNDSAVIASGYTVVVNNGVSFSSGQGLQMSGSARLQTSGSNALDLSGSQNLNVSGGSLAAGGNFKLGSNAQAITANVTAASVTTGGSSAKITGTVAATGLIDLGSSTTITGAVSGGSIKTNSDVILGPLTITGAIDLGSSNTINGAVSGASISTNSSVTMGPLSITGTVDLGSSNTINGSISANNIKTNSSLVVSGSVSVSGLADLGSGIKISGSVSAGSVKTNSPAQIGGAITAAGTVDLGSGVTVGGNVSGTTITTNSPVNITGNVSASTSFTLSSGSTVTGNITSPTVKLNASGVTVKGDIAASGSLDIGSGTTVTGNLTGGSLNLRASGVTVNGNVTFTGDVDMGSGDTINGDLSAHNVTTHSSGATINGNAAVNAIYLDWGASVSKTITCTGAAPGAPVCSCVTKADSSYQPTCGAPAPVGAHHILITHGGSALTCQPQTVTLRACADPNCSTTYTGSTSITLSPGGGAVAFNGNTTATVRQTAATVATLSTSATTTCLDSSTNQSSCAMSFKDNGLEITAPDHVSMSGAQLTVQALKSAPGGGSCVPLVQNATVPVKFSCGYMNPATARTIPVTIGGTDVSCGSGTTDVSLSFNASGLATPSLQYAEAGQVNVSASYTGSGANANLAASGSDDFVAAPATFKIEAATTTSAALSNGAFARAGDTFTLTVTALNASNQVTRNFGKELSPESFSISEKIKLPSDGNNAITQGQFDAIVDGAGKSKSGSAGQWAFGEAGTITLDAKLANASTYYMGRTVTNFNTKGTLDLRFVPHHFDTALVAGGPADIPMSCAGLGGYNNPCTSPSSYFVYSKQGFYLKVSAYKSASVLSANYRPKSVAADSASVAKDIYLSAWTSANGATQAPAIKATPANAVDANDVKFLFAGGVGLVSTAKLPALELTATPPVPVTVFLRATDEDGASSLRAGAAEAPLTVVNGRLQVQNSYGSATSPMPIEVRAQYYSGAAGAYVFNSQFSPVSPAAGANVALTAANVSYAQCTGALSCAALKLKEPSTLSFKNGKAVFLLSAPNASGSANVSLATVISYLPAPDPSRATFGIYRSGPVIYTREVHN